MSNVSREQAAAYCKDIQKVEGYQAWIIGIVEKGNRWVDHNRLHIRTFTILFWPPLKHQDCEDHWQAKGDRSSSQGEGGRAVVEKMKEVTFPASRKIFTYSPSFMTKSTLPAWTNNLSHWHWSKAHESTKNEKTTCEYQWLVCHTWVTSSHFH